MAPPVDKLKTLLHDVLDAIGVYWDGDASDLPELQYVADGAVAWDGCEVLATSFVRTFAPQGGDLTLEGFTSTPNMLLVRAAVVDIFLLRCVPTFGQEGTEITMPSTSDVETAADQILVDAQALTNAVVAAAKAGDLPGCQGLALEGCTAVGPEGGMGGNVLRIRLGML